MSSLSFQTGQVMQVTSQAVQKLQSEDEKKKRELEEMRRKVTMPLTGGSGDGDF